MSDEVTKDEMTNEEMETVHREPVSPPGRFTHCYGCGKDNERGGGRGDDAVRVEAGRGAAGRLLDGLSRRGSRSACAVPPRRDFGEQRLEGAQIGGLGDVAIEAGGPRSVEVLARGVAAQRDEED